MTQESHDHNFKNVLLDFPVEALEWVLPQTLKEWGPVRHVEFVRQEPKKRKLSDSHLVLDMPILFSFERHQLLLWLTEFQEDKSKFSIYKVLRYMTDLMEAHPKALVIPTVMFTDRRDWRKDVLRQLEAKFANRVFLHFEYVFVKLFDFNARDYFNVANPVVKILLPKMNYAPEERWEVIRQAYIGLFQLVSAALFSKYVDFIDVYAEITDEEQEILYEEIKEDKETAMLAQYIRNKGFQEGQQEASITLASEMHRLPHRRELPILLYIPVNVRNSQVRHCEVQFHTVLKLPIKPMLLYETLLNVLTKQSPRFIQPVTMQIDNKIGEHHPLRILLAEDNVVNQKVAMRFLERMGYKIDMACNGREVLEILQCRWYDVVLMDVQMPEMDGMEATQHIRSMLPTNRQPWIIAMTAHVMEGDREWCLSAGMDDYVSKPIQVSELSEALLRVKTHAEQTVCWWDGHAPVSSDGLSEPHLHEEAAEEMQKNLPSASAHHLSDGLIAPLDSEIYEQFRSMICADNLQLMREFIELFLSDSAENLIKMRQSVEQHKSYELQRVAHSQKSSSAQLGAIQLSHLCKELEVMGKQGVLVGAIDLIDRSEQEYERVREALLEHLTW